METRVNDKYEPKLNRGPQFLSERREISNTKTGPNVHIGAGTKHHMVHIISGNQ